MQNDNLSLPIWGRRPLPPNTTAYYDFQYDPPPEPVIHHTITVALAEAEKLYERGEYGDAAALPAPVAAADGLARTFLLDCLVKLKDIQSLLAHFHPPASAAEAIHLMDALWASGKRERLGELLSITLIAESADPSLIEMRNKYAARLKR